MSAVATTPRAKSAKKAPVAKDTVQARLQTLQSALREADNKIEQAYDAAERGEPVDVLLDHIAHHILPDAVRPMLGKSPTYADAEAAYTAMFAPLAALKGAISLAGGTVIHHTLVEAFDLLDWAQNELDICSEFVKMLPPQTKDERDFLRGRDIAISLLCEARQMVDTDQSSARRWHRDGKPQENFVYGYLTDIIEDPSMQRGFSAVLSAAIGADMIDTPDFFADIPMAEYQAGEIGADGTMTDHAPEVVESTVQFQEKSTATTSAVEVTQVPVQAISRFEATNDLDAAQLYSQTLLFLLRCIELDELEHPTSDVNDPHSKTQCSLVLLDALADQQARADKAINVLCSRSTA